MKKNHNLSHIPQKKKVEEFLVKENQHRIEEIGKC